MNKKGNTKAIVNHSKQNSDLCKKRTLEAIDAIIASGEPFTLQAVANKAGVTRQFIYDHEDILSIINSYRKKSSNKKHNDAKDVIINNQKHEIERLKKQLKAVEINENYKDKYEKLLVEYKELKEQFFKLQTSNLDLNF